MHRLWYDTVLRPPCGSTSRTGSNSGAFGRCAKVLFQKKNRINEQSEIFERTNERPFTALIALKSLIIWKFRLAVQRFLFYIYFSSSPFFWLSRSIRQGHHKIFSVQFPISLSLCLFFNMISWCNICGSWKYTHIFKLYAHDNRIEIDYYLIWWETKRLHILFVVVQTTHSQTGLLIFQEWQKLLTNWKKWGQGS